MKLVIGSRFEGVVADNVSSGRALSALSSEENQAYMKHRQVEQEQLIDMLTTL